MIALPDRLSGKKQMPHPEMIAHRGASLDAPENTLAAVELAWQQQADAVEIDIRLTRDGQIVVIHDSDTARTSNHRLSVAESTYAELKEVDVGCWKGPAYQGESIPRLEDILATLRGQARLFIEIKCGAEICVPLLDLLTAVPKLEAQLVLIGFDAPLLAQLKTSLPAAQALLCARRPQQASGHWSGSVIEQLIDEAKRLQFDGVDLDAAGPIDRPAVDRLHAAKLGCYFWTVDDLAQAVQLSQCGVDGLTTNRPGWLRSQLADTLDTFST